MAPSVPFSTSSTTTPLFSIFQTHTSITLSIRAPHCRPHDVEVSADGPIFTFYCNPYALRLTFDHAVYFHHPCDAPPQHTTYDFTTGIAHVTLRKTDPGTHFQKLDILSTVLHQNPVHPSSHQSHATIQATSSATTPDQTNHPSPETEILPKTPLTTQSVTRTLQSVNEEFAQTANIAGVQIPLRELTLTRPTYGFASRYEAVFSIRADDASQIVLLPDPDTTPVWRRPALRKAAEDAKFNPDHYIADFLLEHEYAHVFDYVPRKRQPVEQGLAELPKREYLPDVDRGAAADLAGILFASAYDERITSGERNVESAWAISRLSPTMAFLEQMQSPREAILAAYRRSLAYPLYRSVKLADRVLEDVKLIFEAENSKIRSTLLSILVELRNIFEAEQLLRLHCDLFLIDYCIWIQAVNEQVLQVLGQQVAELVIERHELEWNLDALENRALRMTTGEECDEEADQAADVQVENMQPANGNGADQIPRDEIVISARSTVPAPSLERMPICSAALKTPLKFGPPEISSTSSEYDSDSTSTTASSGL